MSQGVNELSNQQCCRYWCGGDLVMLDNIYVNENLTFGWHMVMSTGVCELMSQCWCEYWQGIATVVVLDLYLYQWGHKLYQCEPNIHWYCIFFHARGVSQCWLIVWCIIQQWYSANSVWKQICIIVTDKCIQASIWYPQCIFTDGRNRAVSFGPVPARFWHIVLYCQFAIWF